MYYYTTQRNMDFLTPHHATEHYIRYQIPVGSHIMSSIHGIYVGNEQVITVINDITCIMSTQHFFENDTTFWTIDYKRDSPESLENTARVAMDFYTNGTYKSMCLDNEDMIFSFFCRTGRQMYIDDEPICIPKVKLPIDTNIANNKKPRLMTMKL